MKAAGPPSGYRLAAVSTSELLACTCSLSSPSWRPHRDRRNTRVTGPSRVMRSARPALLMTTAQPSPSVSSKAGPVRPQLPSTQQTVSTACSPALVSQRPGARRSPAPRADGSAGDLLLPALRVARERVEGRHAGWRLERTGLRGLLRRSSPGHPGHRVVLVREMADGREQDS